MNGEVSWEVGRSCIGGSDVVPSLRQVLMKQPGDIRPGFFCPIVPETRALGIFDHILNDPFPAVVRECNPINLRLSIPLKKRICSLTTRYTPAL